MQSIVEVYRCARPMMPYPHFCKDLFAYVKEYR